MSENIISTTCPSCGSITEFEPATTLMPGSEALLDLYKGELNTCICPTCDQSFRIETPILFRDDDSRSLVYLLPDDDADEENVDALVDRIVKDAFGPTKKEAIPTVRVVTEHSHFLEKIAILQKGLDDRIIEYVKYLLFENSDEVDNDTFELLFDFTADSPDTLAFIAFERETRKGEYELSFDKSDYAELATAFTESPEASAKLAELFPGHIVTVQRLLVYAAETESFE